jgi:hypothetical protein
MAPNTPNRKDEGQGGQRDMNRPDQNRPGQGGTGGKQDRPGQGGQTDPNRPGQGDRDMNRPGQRSGVDRPDKGTGEEGDVDEEPRRDTRQNRGDETAGE